MTPSRTAKRWARGALITLATATLIGCGASSSDGGGRTAGIEGTGVTSGFGSVYVGGIEFATEDAEIRFNGEPVDEQALQVGDVVRVSGEVDGDGQGRARRIVFDRNLRGPITGIERQADGRGELTVLGQRVRFDANTHFIDVDDETLKTGDLIAVSGFGNDNGALRATLLEREGRYRPGMALEVEVEGRIVDLRGDRFRIGDLTIVYSLSNVEGGGALSAGDYVQVIGDQSRVDAPLSAQRIERPRQKLGANSQRVFVHGMVSDIDGDHFSVAGQRIDAGNAQRSGAIDAPLTDDATVLIHGTRRAGVIVAETVRLEAEPRVTLRARLDTLDDAEERVVLLGSEWSIKADTRYLDQTEPGDRRLRLDRLAPGDTIQAIGYRGADRLIMTRLNRVDADPEGNAMLSGPIERIRRDGARVRIDLAGTTVTANTNRTDFQNAAGQKISASAFQRAAQPGVPVEAKGPANADRIDVARVVRLLE